jgi:hypothetical protein
MFMWRPNTKQNHVPRIAIGQLPNHRNAARIRILTVAWSHLQCTTNTPVANPFAKGVQLPNLSQPSSNLANIDLTLA